MDSGLYFEGECDGDQTRLFPSWDPGWLLLLLVRSLQHGIPYYCAYAATAASALSRADQGSSPSFGGQKFADGTCIVGGTETFESVGVVVGVASFVVAALEALVVYLK